MGEILPLVDRPDKEPPNRFSKIRVNGIALEELQARVEFLEGLTRARDEQVRVLEEDLGRAVIDLEEMHRFYDTAQVRVNKFRSSWGYRVQRRVERLAFWR